MHRTTGVALVVLLAAGVAPAAEQPSAKGKVESVTLYRGQALVTRLVPFRAPAGATQLTVTDLPESVLPDSLYASAGRGVQVRAVRFRTLAVGKAPQEEVRKLDDQIAEVEKKTRENTHNQQLLGQQKVYLDGLQSFAAPTAQVEMTKGVLNPETLAKVTTMMFERREDLSKKLLALQEETYSLRDALALLQRQHAELTRESSKTLREAVVFLDKAEAGDSSIRLSYLAGNATWEPTYNLRATADLASVNVEYAALAKQMSGEDWEDVTLTLSTAVARMVATGPTMAPMWVTLTTNATRYAGIGDVERRLKSYGEQLRGGQDKMQRSARVEEQVDSQWEMNKAASSFQSLELTADAADVNLVRKMLTESATGLSVNYRLQGKVSLSGRRENQMVEISKLKLPAKFYYEAVPLLSEYVYRYALLSNESELSLLEGQANMYLDGDFVGVGKVAMVARGQRFTVGFGIEPQLRAWREFVAKEERTQGGNRNITTKYRLVLDNYSDKAIEVRVVDRIPVSKADIRVTLGELKDTISKDEEYLRAFRPRGILRWDIAVPAKSAADKALILEYSYTLEFDRNLHIASEMPETAAPAAKKEMLEMMHSR